MNTQIVKDYNEGKSISAISRELGWSNRKVRDFLVKNNCKIRNRSEQNFYSNQARSKTLLDNYFEVIDCPEKAWMLGFIAADGTISKNRNRIKIGLSRIDEEILLRIKDELQIERDLVRYTSSNGFEVSELTWSSHKMKRDLAKFGIVPNKTYLNSLSIKNIPENLKSSYILGYFDGDGCLRRDGRFEICSYTDSLLIEFSDFLNKLTGQRVRAYSSPNRKNYYTITYSSIPAKKILSMLYSDNPKMFLKRKHILFQNITKPRDYDNH